MAVLELAASALAKCLSFTLKLFYVMGMAAILYVERSCVILHQSVKCGSTVEPPQQGSSDSGGLGLVVGCFGFNGPFRQYFSLYWAISQREGERGEKG